MESGAPSQNAKDAFSAVGVLFHHFAHLEVAVNEAIGKATGINDVNTHVVVSALAFGKKLDILRKVAKQVEANRLKRPFADVVVEIQDLAKARNRFAHHVFEPASGGVNLTLIGVESHPVERFFSFGEMKTLSDRMRECRYEVETFAEAVIGLTAKEFLDIIMRDLPSDGDREDG